jgi:transcriptional regulator
VLYNPPRFQQHEREEIDALIDRYPLATLISVDGGAPVVSHIPLVREGSKLIGHLARANPHWKLLNGRPVTAIFHGPQGYITPKWYTKNDVPTWSYAVVHVEGEARLIEDFAGVEACLRKLTDHAEKGFDDKWEYWLPEDLATPEKVTRAIAGFEILVSAVNAKFKFLKSKPVEDQKNVIAQLEKGDCVSRSLASLMKK